MSASRARAPLLESLAVLAGALLVVAVLAWLDGPAPDLRGDQNAINLMVVKALHPDWFAGDPLYGRDPSRFYTPTFLGLQTALARRLDGDPTRALQALLWPVGVLFLAGHYVLFRGVTGSPWAAALGALAATTTRNALGGEYWGFSGLESVQPRVIVLGAAPLLVLAFLRWRQTRWLPAFFLLTGVVANFHPIGGLHLCQIAIVTHLALERARPRAWLDAAVGGVLFLVGASPFVLAYLEGRENVTNPALFAVLRAAVEYRFDYLLLPQKTDALLSVAFHVTVVPYGVDARFAPRPRRADLVERWGLRDRMVILFFGGLKPRKNLGVLLDVWARAIPAHADARLVVAGGGPMLSALRARAERLGLASSVVFTGYVPEADKADVYNLADVFFFPSAMEGFGLAVAEAMSSGLPIVASDRGSIPELVVEGEGGFLADPSSADGFVERLRLLLADAPLRAKLGRANAERVERSFRWDRCVDGTRRVYETVLEARRRRRTLR